MDALKNLFNPLTERAKSPLFGTLIISWLFWNWKIVFTILFLFHEDFGGKSMIDFIVANYKDPCNNIVYPIVTTGLYIWLAPWLELWVFKYAEKRKREKIDEKIKIGRKHHVLGDLYYDLKIRFEEEKAKVLRVESDLKLAQTNFTKTNNELTVTKRENARIQDENTEWREKFEKYQSRHNPDNYLNGRWIVFHSNEIGKEFEEHINIFNSKYSIVANGSDQHRYDIRLFEFDEQNNTLKFVKYAKDSNDKHRVVDLRAISNERYEGTENDKSVIYTRPKFDNKIDINSTSTLIDKNDVKNEFEKFREEEERNKRIEESSKF